MRITYLYIFAFSILALGVANANSQTLEQRGFKPIDPLIDDVDPLALSLRQHAVELKNDGGGRQRYFRRTIPGNSLTGRKAKSKIYLIERGVVAEFDRSDYSRNQKGRIFSLVPPNTVFHLGIPKDNPKVKASNLPSPKEFIDGRIRGTTELAARSRIMASNISRPITNLHTNKRYRTALDSTHQRQLRLQAVLSAIDKINPTPPTSTPTAK